MANEKTLSLWFEDNADKDYPKVWAATHEEAARLLSADPDRVWRVG